MKVDRAVTGFFRVEIDLPQLPQAVGLDEMAFVVNVESVIDSVALEIGHETGDIDDCQEDPFQVQRCGCQRDYRAGPMNPDRLGLLHDVADAVASALAKVTDFGPSGGRVGQYSLDVVANEAALGPLRHAGVGILSEESDFEPGATGEIVVIDPIDGSTNASIGVRYFATAMCVVDADGPSTALVVNQATGERFWATRGGGGWCDGARLEPSRCVELNDSILGLNGLPPNELGYRQCRVLGAVALDLCLVAAGTLDGYVACVDDGHGVWDYLASVLICREAGAPVVDLEGRDLLALDHASRRTLVAAGTDQLLAQLIDARRYAGRPIEGA